MSGEIGNVTQGVGVNVSEIDSESRDFANAADKAGNKDGSVTSNEVNEYAISLSKELYNIRKDVATSQNGFSILNQPNSKAQELAKSADAEVGNKDGKITEDELNRYLNVATRDINNEAVEVTDSALAIDSDAYLELATPGGGLGVPEGARC